MDGVGSEHARTCFGHVVSRWMPTLPPRRRPPRRLRRRRPLGPLLRPLRPVVRDLLRRQHVHRKLERVVEEGAEGEAARAASEGSLRQLIRELEVRRASSACVEARQAAHRGASRRIEASRLHPLRNGAWYHPRMTSRHRALTSRRRGPASSPCPARVEPRRAASSLDIEPSRPGLSHRHRVHVLTLRRRNQ